ncbi:MAG: hypothetical protein EPN99_17080 [Frankiales bacterium]|nr:MAG: hypothetical protein EPN99_17080 [Frankiales bacterium]
MLAGGTAVALTGLGEPDELRPAPFASSEPERSPTPSPRPWFLPDVLLTPEEAGRAELPGWVVDPTVEPDSLAPAADPCREGRIPLDDRVTDQGEQVMGSRREVGGSSLHQEVYRYETAADAAAAFAEYEQQYSRCPDEPDPAGDGPGSTIRAEVRQREGSPDSDRMLVRSIPCGPDGGCVPHFATYTMLVREAEAVTLVVYLIGEDGDPAEDAASLLDAVQERLRRVVTG